MSLPPQSRDYATKSCSIQFTSFTLTRLTTHFTAILFRHTSSILNPSPRYRHQSHLRLAVLAKRAAQFSHLHKITPTIPTREPIFRRGRRLRHCHWRDRGGRHFVTDPQAPNWGLRIQNYDGGHCALVYERNSSGPTHPSLSKLGADLAN